MFIKFAKMYHHSVVVGKNENNWNCAGYFPFHTISYFHFLGHQGRLIVRLLG